MAWALLPSGLWVLLGLLLAGVGLLLGRALDGGTVPLEDAPEAFWLGWAGALALLQPFQLLVPSGPWLFLVLIPFSIAGWVRGLSHPLPRPRPASVAAPVGVFLVLLVPLGLAALKPPLFYDAGLYHLQAIRWAETFRDVPGLGNLHFRLGFASAHFPFVAALDPGLGPLRGYHVASGLFVAAFGLFLLLRLRASAARGIGALDLLDLVSAAALFSLWKLASSPDVDAPLTLLGLLLARSVVSPSPRRLAALPVLASAGVALKLSFAPFAALAVLAACLVPAREGGLASSRRLLRALTLCALLLAGWAARGAVLSGYLAFPIRATGLPVEHRIPEADASATADLIRSWARSPRPDHATSLHSWSWVPSWFLRSLRDPAAAAAFLASAGWLAAALVRRLRRTPPDASLPPGWGRLLLVVAPGLAAWFLAAPDPRFARPLLWALAAVAMAGAAAQAGLSPRVRSLAALAGTGALALFFLARPGVFPDRLIEARPLPPPQVPLRTVTLPSGFEVLSPVEGDRCGDAPIPCTPYPDPRLRLRDPRHVEAGFLK